MPHFASREEYERWKAERLGKPYVPAQTMTAPGADGMVASPGGPAIPAAPAAAARAVPAAAWATTTPVPGPGAAPGPTSAAAPPTPDAPPMASLASPSAERTAPPPGATAARRPTPVAIPAAAPRRPTPAATPAPLPASAPPIATTPPRTSLLLLACVLVGSASMYLFAVEAFSAAIVVLGIGALAAGAFWYFGIRPRLSDPETLPAAFVPAAHPALRSGASGEDVAATATPGPPAGARHEAHPAKANG